MKTSKYIFIALLACVSISFAQPKQPMKPKDPAQAEALKELRTKIVSFFQNTVEPEMLKWKTQLDAALSPDDLQALNKLRKEAKEVQLDEKSANQQIQQAWRDEDYTALKKSRDAKKELDKDRKELLADLKPIAVKYKSTLVSIGEIAKPKAAEWKADGKKFVEAWVARYKDTFGEEGMKQAIAILTRRFAGIPGLDKDTKAKVAAAKFMLWDGSDFTKTFDNGVQGGIQGGNNSPE
jgi:hypothetical protein